jgi:hypothetical protein
VSPPEKALALASLRVLYYAGILKMPLAVQTHMRLCHNDPAECLLCKMTQLQIESLKARMEPAP